MSNSDLNLKVVIKGDATQGTNAVNQTEQAADKLKNTTMSLKNTLLGLFGLSFGVVGLKDIANTADKCGSLKNATNGAKEFAESQQFIIETSHKTFTSLEANTELFNKINRSLRDIGGNVKQSMGLTEIIAKLAGMESNAAGANAGVYQLTQSIASGKFAGDEFRSVSEQLPILASTLAKGLGVSLGQLREMSKEGNLGTAEIMRGLFNQKEEVEKAFQNMPVTLGKSLQNLESYWLEFIGRLNDGSGTTKMLASGVDLLAKNINVLGGGLLKIAQLGAMVGLVKFVEIVTKGTIAIQAKSAATKASLQESLRTAEANVAEINSEIQLATIKKKVTENSLAEGMAEKTLILQKRQAVIEVTAQAEANLRLAESQKFMSEATLDVLSHDAQLIALNADLTATTEALAMAEQQRSTAMSELAIAGQQQARVQQELAALNIELQATTNNGIRQSIELKIADLEATNVAIVTAREQALANLQVANSDKARAETALSSLGATVQTTSIQYLARQEAQKLAVAQAELAATTNELAVLGRQSSNLNVQGAMAELEAKRLQQQATVDLIAAKIEDLGITTEAIGLNRADAQSNLALANAEIEAANAQIAQIEATIESATATEEKRIATMRLEAAEVLRVATLAELAELETIETVNLNALVEAQTRTTLSANELAMAEAELATRTALLAREQEAATVAAGALSGAMTTKQIFSFGTALNAVMAGYAGYEIGGWLREKSTLVEKFGIYVAGAAHSLWELAKVPFGGSLQNVKATWGGYSDMATGVGDKSIDERNAQSELDKKAAEEKKKAQEEEVKALDEKEKKNKAQADIIAKIKKEQNAQALQDLKDSEAENIRNLEASGKTQQQIDAGIFQEKIKTANAISSELQKQLNVEMQALKDHASGKKKLDTDGLTAVKESLKQIESAKKANIDALNALEKEHRDKAIALDKEIKDVKKQGQDGLRDIARAGMTDAEVAADKSLEIEQKTAQYREMMRNKDYTQAAEIGKELNALTKEQGMDAVKNAAAGDKQSAAQTAQNNYKQSIDLTTQALEAQKAEEQAKAAEIKAQADLQRKAFENVGNQIQALNDTLTKGAALKIVVDSSEVDKAKQKIDALNTEKSVDVPTQESPVPAQKKLYKTVVDGKTSYSDTNTSDAKITAPPVQATPLPAHISEMIKQLKPLNLPNVSQIQNVLSHLAGVQSNQTNSEKVLGVYRLELNSPAGTVNATLKASDKEVFESYQRYSKAYGRTTRSDN